MTLITPTIGRVVWFYPEATPAGHPEDQPFAALVTYVHSDRCINVAAFDHNGDPLKYTSVRLLQQGDPKPASGSYAQWMPYQLGQAKKHEGVSA